MKYGNESIIRFDRAEINLPGNLKKSITDQILEGIRPDMIILDDVESLHTGKFFVGTLDEWSKIKGDSIIEQAFIEDKLNASVKVDKKLVKIFIRGLLEHEKLVQENWERSCDRTLLVSEWDEGEKKKVLAIILTLSCQQDEYKLPAGERGLAETRAALVKAREILRKNKLKELRKGV